MSANVAKNVVLVGILTALALSSGCSSCEQQPEAREREPLSLIPDDSLLVGTIEMDPVRRSAAYKRILRRGNPMASYLGDCSYDPLPDVDRVWFGGNTELEKGRGSLVVIGPVQRDKVLDCYRDHLRTSGLRLEENEIEGFTVYAAGPGRPHVAWVDQETILIGDRGNVEKMLSLEKGKGKSIRENVRLLKLYERMAEGNHVAVAALPDEGTTKRVAERLPESWRATSTTKQLGIGVRISKGMDLLLSIRLARSPDAVKLTDQLKRALERWQDHDYVVIAGLSSHLKAVRIEGAGSEITARANWTDRQVDTLTRLAVDSIEEVMRGNAEDLRRRIQAKVRSDGGPAKAGDGGAPEGGASDGGTGDGGGDGAAPTKASKTGATKAGAKAPTKATPAAAGD